MLSCLAPGAPPQTPLTGLRTLRNRAGTITAYDSSFMLAVVACVWGMLVVADISYCGSKSWSSIIFTTSPLAKSWIRAWSVTVVVGDTWSPRFVKPGALIGIWGPRTLGLLLIATAELGWWWRRWLLSADQRRHGRTFVQY